MQAKILLVLFTLLLSFNSGLALPAMALSDADYKVMMQDQGFATADKSLGAAWKAVNSLLEGQAKQVLLANQKEWIAQKRDAYAKDMMSGGLSKVQAYTVATKDRVKMLQIYGQQVQKPNTFIELSGEILSIHNADATRFLGYGLVLPNEVKNYYASPTYFLPSELDEKSGEFADLGQIVKISGKLVNIDSFDPATVKIIP